MNEVSAADLRVRFPNLLGFLEVSFGLNPGNCEVRGRIAEMMKKPDSQKRRNFKALDDKGFLLTHCPEKVGDEIRTAIQTLDGGAIIIYRLAAQRKESSPKIPEEVFV